MLRNKAILLCFFLFAISCMTQVSQKSLFKNVSFQTPEVRELKELTDFAVISNDVYQTRKASRELAMEVFAPEAYQVEKKLIEKLVNEKGEILGFYSLKKPSKDASGKIEIELGHLFVKPGYLRKGLGTLLFERACQKAKLLHAARMHWISDPDAEGFYLKQGASMTGHDKNLLNPDVPVPLFELIFPTS